MQVTEVNDIKTYNLSHGKTIPDWLSDRKKRMLLKKDVDLRRRIQLIQDFDMPTLSNTVNVSKDGQYVITTGIYKPRIRCYDVNQLSMKFERCLDAEVVKCKVLSDDYTKLLFLEEERYVELHSQFGFYYKTRIPKFGRDLEYNYSTCDAYFVGNSSDIYRLNLEVGTFLKPFETKYSELNTIKINDAHNLVVVGSKEGFVNAWDPRVRESVATLDCAFDIIRNDTNAATNEIPAITSLNFRNALTMGVGTSTGQILMYDIRSNRPYLAKDHMYGLPIKTIDFLDGPLELVASLDSKIIKFWNVHNGSPFTAIQSESDFNMLCSCPNSGMLFVANESPKVLAYYIPAIGPAPKWCSFLDRITEELEESNENIIYDDYKFLTEQELEEIGLTDLIGTNLLRAHMHGYFIDMRLYRKAKDASQQFAYDEYKKKKIQEKIDSERTDRVQIEDHLPKVNRSLAERLIYEEEMQKKKSTKSNKYKPNPLKDDRFTDLFQNPDFQIDELSEEFRLLNPVLSKMSIPSAENTTTPIYAGVFEEDNAMKDTMTSSSDEDFDDDEGDDDEEDEEGEDIELEKVPAKEAIVTSKPKPNESAKKITAFKLKSGIDYAANPSQAGKQQPKSRVNLEKQTFEQRLKRDDRSGEELMRLLKGGVTGNRVMTFIPKARTDNRNNKETLEKEEKRKVELKAHLTERKQLARRAKNLKFNRKKFS